MPPAKIHQVGPHRGSCEELSMVVGIAPANFGRRLQKFYNGEYTVSKTMKRGRLSTKHNEDCGTTEWKTLSNKLKDARLKPEDIPDNWLSI